MFCLNGADAICLMRAHERVSAVPCLQRGGRKADRLWSKLFNVDRCGAYCITGLILKTMWLRLSCRLESMRAIFQEELFLSRSLCLSAHFTSVRGCNLGRALQRLGLRASQFPPGQAECVAALKICAVPSSVSGLQMHPGTMADYCTVDIHIRAGAIFPNSQNALESLKLCSCLGLWASRHAPV